MSTKHGLGATDAVDPALADDVAAIMQALATRSRVRILGRLAAGPCNVGELVDALGMEQSAVSHQLRTLRMMQLVVGERHGRTVIYELHDSHVGQLLGEAVAHAAHRRLVSAAHGRPADASAA